MPSKRYSVYFNQGQDVMFTNDIAYEVMMADDQRIVMLKFVWNSDKILMPLHNVTYLKETNFDG